MGKIHSSYLFLLFVQIRRIERRATYFASILQFTFLWRGVGGEVFSQDFFLNSKRIFASVIYASWKRKQIG